MVFLLLNFAQSLTLKTNMYIFENKVRTEHYTLIGEFSSNAAATVAITRIVNPDYLPSRPEKPQDLAEEIRMLKRIECILNTGETV